ncbi:unnamed protein product [Closterium sp. NIES-54]
MGGAWWWRGRYSKSWNGAAPLAAARCPLVTPHPSLQGRRGTDATCVQSSNAPLQMPASDSRPCCCCLLHPALMPAPALRAPFAREQLLPQRAQSAGLRLQGSRPTALRVAPCCSPRVTPYCSPRVALCCPARRALLQPARRALLQPARRALLLRASRPTAARASRSAAQRVAPCCSLHVAPCCPARRALLQPARRALLPAPPSRSRAAQPEPPSCYYCCCCCSCYCCCWWRCCWECWRCRRPAPPNRPAATTAATAACATAAAAGGAGGAAGSTGGAAGARGAGPTTDRHCLSWPLSWQLQRLGVDSSGHCLSRTTPPLSSFVSGIFSEVVLVVEVLVLCGPSDLAEEKHSSTVVS